MFSFFANLFYVYGDYKNSKQKAKQYMYTRSPLPEASIHPGVFIIANHERAAVLYCYKSNAATQKYFNNGGGRRYHSSKNKKIWDRVDLSVQFGWRLQVLGS